jgi:hypothetical protein
LHNLLKDIIYHLYSLTACRLVSLIACQLEKRCSTKTSWYGKKPMNKDLLIKLDIQIKATKWNSELKNQSAGILTILRINTLGKK